MSLFSNSGSQGLTFDQILFSYGLKCQVLVVDGSWYRCKKERFSHRPESTSIILHGSYRVYAGIRTTHCTMELLCVPF